MREPELLGQTVVVIGGSAAIGLETARRARAAGADVILTGRDPDRLRRAASELDARSIAAFDATDPAALEALFQKLPDAIDHVMVTAGRPYYGLFLEMDVAQARRALDDHLRMVIQVARNAAEKVRPVGGDIVYWPPGPHLAVFYRQDGRSLPQPGMIRLGSTTPAWTHSRARHRFGR